MMAIPRRKNRHGNCEACGRPMGVDEDACYGPHAAELREQFDKMWPMSEPVPRLITGILDNPDRKGQV